MNEMHTRQTGPWFWVGIGASAGGLEAIRGLVRRLPADMDATVIIAQHMAPHHRSLLTAIIGRETTLPVLDVEDGLKPARAAIYITPPNRNVVVRGGRLHLEALTQSKAAPKPSVDMFLQSLAKDLGERAIAIILSGTGSDGAVGIRAIAEGGGITIAQDEHTARYTGMPNAARKTGLVDLVLSPEEVGAGFHALLSRPRNLDVLRHEPLDESSLSALTRLLFKQTRVDFGHYKIGTVQRRVERRMAAVHAASIEDYLRIARESAQEVDLLFKDLMITVTSFFRDPEEFEGLVKHVERIIEARSGQDIRVWVAAVATGEEVYSLAMLFAEALGGLDAFAEARLLFFATDIDADAIEIARRGRYAEMSLSALDTGLIERYFVAGSGGYTVAKALRDKVVFSVHDVARDAPFMHVDLLSCRNLLIYFQAELQARVFNRFHFSLRDEAVLFLGKSEAVSASADLFESALPDKHIFLQRSSRPRRLEGQPSAMRLPVRAAATKSGSDESRATDAATSQLESLIEAIGPDALLVNDDVQVIKVFGNVDAFIGIASSLPIDTSVGSLVREPWSQDIRAALPSALRNERTSECLVRKDPDDPACLSRVIIYPIHDRVNDSKSALVVFRSWSESVPEELAGSEAGEGNEALLATIRTLHHELGIARTNLQTAIEELQTSNEELQAVNEELQSSNEELQSTNEELETSSEELQSTNEELTTLNDELSVNAQQLHLTNQSQRTILDNVQTPTIVIDPRMRVIDSSLSAAALIDLPDDIERPPLSACVLTEGFPELDSLVVEALDRREPIDRMVSTATIDSTVSVAPYFRSSGQPAGVIVQVSDNTQAIRKIKEELELIFEFVPAAILLCEADGAIVNVNRRARDWLGLDEELPCLSVESVLPSEAAKLFDRAISRRDSERDVVSTVFALRNDGEPDRWMSARSVSFMATVERRDMLLVVLEDITQRHEQAMRNDLLRTRMDMALSASRIGTWEHEPASDVHYWSERTREIMGRPQDVEPGRQSFIDQVHDADDGARESLESLLAGGGESCDVRLRIEHDDGDLRWVSVRGQRYVRADLPDRVIGTLIDETELIEQLETLREQNNHLKLAERLSGVGYWSVGIGDDMELTWSEQVFAIHGTDSSSYVPDLETAARFYHEDDVEQVQAHLAKAMADGSGFRFTARIHRADGELRTVSSLGVVQLDVKGEATAVFGVLQDVTDAISNEQRLRAARDELARSNEELGRFSYVCSHDMKEPVRLIESMSGMLQEPDAFDDQEDALELLSRINRNTHRLAAIIDSLLAYSRAEARVESTAVDLDQLIAEVRENLSLVIESNDAVLEIGPLPIVHGARVHFTQLLQNLIGNALRYANKPVPRIRVTSSSDETGCRIVVEDNGPGISEDHRCRVFDVFTRLNLSSEIEGSGLGLSICKRIVEQYDGTIRCSDSELGGARFTIDLPASAG